MIIFSAIAAVIGAIGGALAAGGAAIGAGLTGIGAAAGLGAAGSLAAGIGGASIVGGLGASLYGTYAQYKAGQAQAAASKRAEGLRKQQMALALQNSALNSQRKYQQDYSTNLVRGTAQLGTGAAFGSALSNSSSSVESALGYQLDTTGQAGSIGYGIFDANAQYSDAARQGSIASGISSLGTGILGNAAAIERVGTYSVGALTGNTYTGALSN